MTSYCGDCGDVIAENPEAGKGRVVTIALPGTHPAIRYDTTVYDKPHYIHLDGTPQCGSRDDATRRKEAKLQAEQQRASAPLPYIPQAESTDDEADDPTCEVCGGLVEVSTRWPGAAPEHVNPEDDTHKVVIL